MIVITLQFRVLLNLDDTVKVEHPSMWDDRKIRWMGAGGSIWKRPVRIPFFSLMVGNEFLWILCFVTTNFMTALKKLCIHQNQIQKDIGFLNKTKMQNINGSGIVCTMTLRGYCKFNSWIVSTKFFSLITTNIIGSKQQKVQRNNH